VRIFVLKLRDYIYFARDLVNDTYENFYDTPLIA